MNFLSNFSNRLLVVETDGFRLRAVVVCSSGGGILVEQVSQSDNADSMAALCEAVEGLKSTKLPRRAILLVPEAVPAVLELPADPKSPLPGPQMQEMVRWELEAHMAQQIGTRPIGEMLVGRGYLTYEQVEAVCQEVDRLKSESSNIGSRGAESHRASRFGEVAIGMGWISRARLDECLALQEQFRTSTEQEIVCGWTAQPSSEFAEPTQHSWLVCGVSRQLRQRWAQVFEKLRIRLVSIYPLVGCSAAALSGNLGDRPAFVVEMQAGLLGATRVVQGRIEEFRLQYTAGRTPSVKMLLGMVGSDRDAAIWLSGQTDQIPTLAKEFTTQVGREVRLVPVQFKGVAPKDLAPGSLANVVGASHHALRLAGPGRIACVPARDPALPLRQRAWVWGAAASLALVLWIGASEVSLSSRMSTATTARTHAEQGKKNLLEKLKISDSKKDALKNALDKIERLEADINDRQKTVDFVKQQCNFFETDAENRARFIPALLDALARAASEKAVVDRIYETEGQEIRVVGWALSSLAAEKFAESLQTKINEALEKIKQLNKSGTLNPSGFVLSEPPVLQEKQGRRGLDGYAIELRFVPKGLASKQLLSDTQEN